MYRALTKCLIDAKYEMYLIIPKMKALHFDNAKQQAAQCSLLLAVVLPR